MHPWQALVSVSAEPVTQRCRSSSLHGFHLVLSDVATCTIAWATAAGPLEKGKAGLVLLCVRTLSEILGHAPHEARDIVPTHIPTIRPKVTFLIQLESPCYVVSRASDALREVRPLRCLRQDSGSLLLMSNLSSQCPQVSILTGMAFKAAI